MDHNTRSSAAHGLREASQVGGERVPRGLDVHARPDPETGAVDAWDVDSWATDPGRNYRLNSLFDRVDGAVVTATGRFDDATACAELTAALRPFERLACAIVVDLCHAAFGLRAARTLVEIGSRHSAGPDGLPFAIVHAEQRSRWRIERAGGHRLLRPPRGRCRAAGE